MEIVDAAGRYADPGEAGAEYVEHLRRSDLSLGTYCLRAGAADRQSPHAEDEVYMVTAGRGRYLGRANAVDVAPGTVLFVPAHEPHRFHDITADLALLVSRSGERTAARTATAPA